MRALVIALVTLSVPGLVFIGSPAQASAPAEQAQSSRGKPAKPPKPSKPYHTVWDDFRNGFTADSPDAKWFYFNAGPFVADDGVTTTSNKGLSVRAAGTNPSTGQPAFTKSVAPESLSGLSGGLDHPKWLVYMNHLASSGIPGFDAEPGKVLSCEMWLDEGRTYGTQNHPFGNDVSNANDDLRLASFAINTVDFETFMVFDFFITNETIYVFYERLPFGREDLGNYASFSHQIPVKSRKPGDSHKLKISYDREAGTVSWFIDNKRVFQVDKIGYRLDREYLTLDHGGIEEIVDMKQMSCGMGLFTLLDARRPGERSLVRLSEIPGTYFNPDLGEPFEENFVDNSSLESSRLFGQGSSMKIRRYIVSSMPATPGHQ